MKSTEQWMHQLGSTESDHLIIGDKDIGSLGRISIVNAEDIKQIQLDAYKQGMTDAALIAEGIAAPSFHIRKARDSKQSV